MVDEDYVVRPFFDPEDQEIPTVGKNTSFFDLNFVKFQLANETSTRANAIATWHRVNYQDIDPKLLRPYLAWGPIRNVKDTLSRTTQMAKMIVNRPLRKHLQPRFSPYCNIK